MYLSNLFSLPRHCNICKFDLCEKCCQPHHSTLHLHDLYRADTELVYQRFSGGWRCDNCGSRFGPPTNKFPYHCNTCEFDLCENCMSITDSKGMKSRFLICKQYLIFPTCCVNILHSSLIYIIFTSCIMQI